MGPANAGAPTLSAATPATSTQEALRTGPVAERRSGLLATTIEPLAPARYKVCFTASAELREKLERLQALMRSPVPDGDLAQLIDIAVSEKLERVEAKVTWPSSTTGRR